MEMNDTIVWLILGVLSICHTLVHFNMNDDKSIVSQILYIAFIVYIYIQQCMAYQ